ncbi:hypothetical protein V8E54_003007 [Elaphomyces granulatus]
MFPFQQYHTQHGNIPSHTIHHQTPAPVRRDGHGYYRNAEGPRGARRQDFHRAEVQLAPYGVPLYSVRHHQQRFDYNRPPASARQAERPINRRDHEQVMRQLNDPGPVRAVVDVRSRGQVVGAMAHPNGNPRGFNRAYIGAMDAQGRRDMRQYQHRHQPNPRVRDMKPSSPTVSWLPRDGRHSTHRGNTARAHPRAERERARLY